LQGTDYPLAYAHITAPLIDPGFHGHITLEIYNHGDNEICLEPGITQVCQLSMVKYLLKISPTISPSYSSETDSRDLKSRTL
jgi:deoxycytidine triphosphate deaminase